MTLLRVILLASHLVAMNMASAGPLVCVWLRRRGRRGDAAADVVGWQLVKLSLWSLVGGMGIGAVLVGIAWTSTDQNYWDAVRRFEPRTFVFAAAELAFTVVCLAAYLATWNRWRGRPWLHGLLAVLAVTNLLYHFPPLMIVLGELAARPELVDAPLITREVFRHLMLQPDVIADVLHFVLASFAVTGLALMHLGRRQQDMISGGAQSPLVSTGAWIALVASLTQLVVGMWVLMQLPLAARNGLVGDDWLASGLFVLSIGAVLGVMHALSSAAMGDTSHAAVWRCTVLMLTVILLMTATQTRARKIEAGGIEQRAGNRNRKTGVTARVHFAAKPQATFNVAEGVL